MRTPDLAVAGRSAAVIVAGLTVAVVVVGVAATSPPRSDPDSGPRAQPAAAPSQSVVDLDQGPAADLEAVTACAGSEFASDPADVEVLYDMTQLTPNGTSPVLVLRNRDGELRLCDMVGADAPGVLPLPRADARQPVVFLSNGTAAWECDAEVVTGYRSTSWLAVAEGVERVEQRFVVDGDPGPWFGTEPVGGIAHLQAWLGPAAEGAEIVVEHRVGAARGSSVDQTTLPPREDLAGCSGAGGDVTIG